MISLLWIRFGFVCRLRAPLKLRARTPKMYLELEEKIVEMIQLKFYAKFNILDNLSDFSCSSSHISSNLARARLPSPTELTEGLRLVGVDIEGGREGENAEKNDG